MHIIPTDTQLFSELYDDHPQAIVWMQPIWDEGKNRIIDFHYKYANEEALKYMNISREQMPELTVFNSYTLNDELRKKIFEEMLNVHSTGIKSETSIFNPVLNKYARVLRSRLRDGILTIIQDFTKEHNVIVQLEEKTKQLEEQTSLLNNILENSSNGISVSQVFRDADGKVVDALTTMANDAAVNYIGLPREIYLTKRATELEPQIMDSPYYQQCIKTLETGEPFLTQYFVNASRRWLELTVSRLDYDHLIQIFTDVTPIKEAQLEIEQTVMALQRSNMYLQDFAHVASHDLKEPLRKILTFTERLKVSLGNNINDKEKHYFERIQDSSQRMLQLIDDILEFSHVGEGSPEYDHIDLNQQVNIVLSDLELAIEEKQAKVIIETPLPSIRGNFRQFQQMLQNILGNSLKYSKKNVPPVIKIRSETITGKEAGVQVSSDHINKTFHLIEISDNGIGFEQQYAGKIFDMLKRLHQKTEYSGTGIGLSIARKVIENHQGYIWAYGQPGVGASFKIMLPAE